MLRLKSMGRRLAVLLGACALLAASIAHAQSPGKWTTLAPFPEPAEELYGVAAGGKLQVIGGLAPGWIPRGLVFEYDPAAHDAFEFPER